MGKKSKQSKKSEPNATTQTCKLPDSACARLGIKPPRCEFCNDPTPLEQLFPALMYNIEGWCCQPCIDYQDAYMNGELLPGAWWGQELGALVEKNGDSPTTSSGQSYTNTGYGCKHLCERYEFVKGFYVYLSSVRGSSTNKETPEYGWPTHSVYAYSGWVRDCVMSNDGSYKPKTTTPAWPVLYLEWTDHGEFPIEPLIDALKWALERIKDPKNRVEIGCMGGHGRTGTFAAALAIAAGKSSHDAITHLRKHYCKQAVEGLKQYGMLNALDNALHGDKAKAFVPPPPPPSSTTPSKYYNKGGMFTDKTIVHSVYCRCAACMPQVHVIATCNCIKCKPTIGKPRSIHDITHSISCRCVSCKELAVNATSDASNNSPTPPALPAPQSQAQAGPGLTPQD